MSHASLANLQADGPAVARTPDPAPGRTSVPPDTNPTAAGKRIPREIRLYGQGPYHKPHSTYRPHGQYTIIINSIMCGFLFACP